MLEQCGIYEVVKDFSINYVFETRNTVKESRKRVANQTSAGVLDMLWSSLVHEYSQRLLSKSRDKIMAFQGLSNEIEKELQSKMVAGTPMRLPLALLWIASRESVRPYPMRAPSWSWLSMDGVIYPEDGKIIAVPKVQLIGCASRFVDSSRSRIQGYLKLRGRLPRAELWRSEDLSQSLECFPSRTRFQGWRPSFVTGREDLFTEESGKESYFRGLWGCKFDPDFDLSQNLQTPIYFLHVMGLGNKHYDLETWGAYCLLLRHGTKAGEFLRIGASRATTSAIQGLVEAMDDFDEEAPFGTNLPFQQHPGAKAYELTLV